MVIKENYYLNGEDETLKRILNFIIWNHNDSSPNKALHLIYIVLHTIYYE